MSAMDNLDMALLAIGVRGRRAMAALCRSNGAVGAGAGLAEGVEGVDACVVGVAPEELEGVAAHLHVLERDYVLGDRGGVQRVPAHSFADAGGAVAAQPADRGGGRRSGGRPSRRW